MSDTNVVGPFAWRGPFLDFLALRNTLICPVPPYGEWANVTDADSFFACKCTAGCEVCKGPGPIGGPCLQCSAGLLLALNGRVEDVLLSQQKNNSCNFSSSFFFGPCAR
jgi:hypothetical protein